MHIPSCWMTHVLPHSVLSWLRAAALAFRLLLYTHVSLMKTKCFARDSDLLTLRGAYVSLHFCTGSTGPCHGRIWPSLLAGTYKRVLLEGVPEILQESLCPPHSTPSTCPGTSFLFVPAVAVSAKWRVKARVVLYLCELENHCLALLPSRLEIAWICFLLEANGALGQTVWLSGGPACSQELDSTISPSIGRFSTQGRGSGRRPLPCGTAAPLPRAGGRPSGTSARTSYLPARC